MLCIKIYRKKGGEKIDEKAYDRLQSDRGNDKEQFTDKLLVLTGCTMDTDEEGRPPWLQLRLDKALSYSI